MKNTWLLLALACVGCSRRLEITAPDMAVPRLEWLDQRVTASGFLILANDRLMLAERADAIRGLPLVARAGSELEAVNLVNRWAGIPVRVEGIYLGHLRWSGIPPGRIAVQQIKKKN